MMFVSCPCPISKAACWWAKGLRKRIGAHIVGFAAKNYILINVIYIKSRLRPRLQLKLKERQVSLLWTQSKGYLLFCSLDNVYVFLCSDFTGVLLWSSSVKVTDWRLLSWYSLKSLVLNIREPRLAVGAPGLLDVGAVSLFLTYCQPRVSVCLQGAQRVIKYMQISYNWRRTICENWFLNFI